MLPGECPRVSTVEDVGKETECTVGDVGQAKPGEAGTIGGSEARRTFKRMKDLRVTGRILEISESTRRRNPHLYGPASEANSAPASSDGKRVRQDKTEVCGPSNKLESDWGRVLAVTNPTAKIHAQSIRFRLGSGAWYKPDFAAMINGRLTAWECKGPKEMKGIAKGILALKVAASQYPDVLFVLVWRERGEWFTQEILP